MINVWSVTQGVLRQTRKKANSGLETTSPNMSSAWMKVNVGAAGLDSLVC